MSPTSGGRSSVYAQQTNEEWATLIELDHASLGSPIRICDSHVNITSNGNLYLAFPIEIVLSSQGEEVPTGFLRIDNTDRTFMTTLRGLETPPTVTVSLVMRSTPDSLEAGPYRFTWKAAEYTDTTLEGQLGYEEEAHRFPPFDYMPSTTPGLF